jgi:hypothetical protein
VPYFTKQVDPGGKPIISAYVAVSTARRSALTAAGRPVPDHLPILGLIDTGASCTCVDPSVLQRLGIPPTGSSSVNSATTGDYPATADQYDVSLLIPGSQGSPSLVYHAIAVLESKLLDAHGFHALIGRDILANCLLTYDGKSGLFIIAY